jgi:hypothetical protein
MPILQNQPNIDNSPWYDIMEDRANTWNRFAIDNNLDIEGYYNASIVTFEIENRKLKAFGIRQVSNVSTLTNIGLEQISEELNISYNTLINLKSNYIRIRKSRIWNSIRRTLKHKIIYNNYFLTYSNENIFQELKNIGLFNFEKIKKLTIDKNGVKLVLHELPVNSRTIDSFLKFCNRLN